MRDDRPSLTAALVAVWRSLGMLLPADVRIADDPYGARFGGPGFAALLALARRTPPLARGMVAVSRRWIAYMQVRTKAIDDVVLDFAAGGGRQLVLLGAGYDCRAARFAGPLGGVQVFEVDHPATQRRKRAAMEHEAQAAVTYVPWDFEARPLADLPETLARRGLDPRAPTLVVWEGVSMYLGEPAIEETFAAVKRLGARGSRLVFTYFEKRVIERPDAAMRASARVVRRIGEPYRYGWEPSELAAWLDERGYILELDRGQSALAALLPPSWRGAVTDIGDHVAVTRTA